MKMFAKHKKIIHIQSVLFAIEIWIPMYNIFSLILLKTSANFPNGLLFWFEVKFRIHLENYISLFHNKFHFPKMWNVHQRAWQLDDNPLQYPLQFHQSSRLVQVLKSSFEGLLFRHVVYSKGGNSIVVNRCLVKKRVVILTYGLRMQATFISL